MSIITIWEDFLKIVKEEAGSRVVETWFKAITFSHWDADSKKIYLKAPNTFIKDWITTHYQQLFHIHFARLLHEEKIEVVFIEKACSDSIQVPQVLSHSNSESVSILPATALKEEEKNSKKDTIPKLLACKSGIINPHYIFDNFVVGPHNSLAYAAAHAVTEKPGYLYNPLFIYGCSGLGKTHLLHAIGNKVKEKYAHVKVIYQSADRFVHDFINAIRFDKVLQFEQRYKTADLLLIDDIQFISNKEQTQEAFFHIFNTLYEARKQIVFSSDSLPKDIAGLADRVRSRLNGGLITDIQKPTLETKIAILKKKAEVQGCILDDSVAYHIASLVKSNIRELEGFLVRVMAFAALHDQDITLELAQKVLEVPTAQESKCKPVIDLPRIAHLVGQHYDYTLYDLRSSKRHKDITRARHVAMYLMKKFTNSSLSDIAAYWRRKDHSTVIHALEKIEYYKDHDALFSKGLQALEKQLGS